MRYFLLSMLMCNTLFAQRMVITERVQSFVITERQEQPNTTVIDTEYEVVICSAKWCSPCQVYKKSGKIEKIRTKYRVAEVDTDERKDWAALLHDGIPAVWLIRKSDRIPIKKWAGTVDLETIEREVTKARQNKTTTKITTKTILRNPSLFGLVGTSHQSRETLINHLHNDGIHRGRHSLNDLQNMSDDELNELHKIDHNW